MNYASALIAIQVAQSRYLEFESTRQLLCVGQNCVNVVIGHDVTRVVRRPVWYCSLVFSPQWLNV